MSLIFSIENSNQKERKRNNYHKKTIHSTKSTENLYILMDSLKKETELKGKKRESFKLTNK